MDTARSFCHSVPVSQGPFCHSVQVSQGYNQNSFSFSPSLPNIQQGLFVILSQSPRNTARNLCHCVPVSQGYSLATVHVFKIHCIDLPVTFSITSFIVFVDTACLLFTLVYDVFITCAEGFRILRCHSQKWPAGIPWTSYLYRHQSKLSSS